MCAEFLAPVLFESLIAPPPPKKKWKKRWMDGQSRRGLASDFSERYCPSICY